MRQCKINTKSPFGPTTVVRFSDFNPRIGKSFYTTHVISLLGAGFKAAQPTPEIEERTDRSDIGCDNDE
jgi:hypothetical protein